MYCACAHCVVACIELPMSILSHTGSTYGAARHERNEKAPMISMASMALKNRAFPPRWEATISSNLNPITKILYSAQSASSPAYNDT